MHEYAKNISNNFQDKIKKIGNGKRLLLVFPAVPHPTDGASVIVFYWYASALKHAGYEILNLLILSDEKNLSNLNEYRCNIQESDYFRIRYLISKDPIVSNKIWGPRSINNILVQECNQIIDKFSPDILVCFDLISAWATVKCKVKKRIIWLGDLNFQTFWYHGIYAFQRKEYKNAFIKFLRSQQWRKAYFEALSFNSKIIVSSGSSEIEVAKIGFCAKYLPYPWPSNDEVPRSTSNTPTLAFFGTHGALGSLSSFRVLTKEIYPKLLKKYGEGNFQIKIFGRGDLPNFVLDKVRVLNEFEIMGFIPDLRIVLSKCHAIIAPVEAPVGNRSRILTALALNIPVIAHSNTALGNPDLISEVNCCLSNNSEDMVKHFYKLVESKEYNYEIAKAGKKLYEEKFNPLVACNMFLEYMM
jgi:glycosyltransferase involved in cell wall biosynthesis